MKAQALGESKAAVAVGAAVNMSTTPFMDRHSVVGCIDVSPNFNGTYKIQGSDDNVTFTDLLTVTGASQPNKKVSIQLKRYMRDNMTVFTAGSASSYLLG
ncbi:MAG: hypothetical protein OEY89_12085 [Gammaproteobacteria bacterium]|nr:hypothetical protein [Gammaproteobacteria bacterium]